MYCVKSENIGKTICKYSCIVKLTYEKLGLSQREKSVKNSKEHNFTPRVNFFNFEYR